MVVLIIGNNSSNSLPYNFSKNRGRWGFKTCVDNAEAEGVQKQGKLDDVIIEHSINIINYSGWQAWPVRIALSF